MSDPNTNNTPVIAAPSAELAPKRDPKITNEVLKQVEAMHGQGRLALPADYHVGNALNSAWLLLQTIENKDKKPIIKNGEIDTSVVTKTSVANALLDYVTQGLNCAKKQAYFIVYDSQLVCQRSYFGDELLAKRVMPGIQLDYDTIREGEKITTTKTVTSRGMVTTINHSDIAFPRNPNIVGAYCGVFNEDGECLGYDIFDIERIKQSWAKSKTYKWSKPDKQTTHDEFPEEMCIHTVVRHRCKPIINASNDSNLIASLRRSEMDSVEAEMADEIAQCGNGDIITVQAEPESLPTSTIAAQLSEEPKAEPVAAAPVDDGGDPY
jgi:recombination protein RecT